MTTLGVRQDVRVTETPWERLFRIAEARRTRLGLTQSGVQAMGGPSPAWIRRLPGLEGEPSSRYAASMRDLDRALQWPEGTSWSLVTKDRSTWSEDLLEDEEHQLVEDMHDEADHFAFIVATRIRALPANRRDDVMREILRILDMPFAGT